MKPFLTVISLCVALAIAGNAFGATITWYGDCTDDWSDAKNWSNANLCFTDGTKPGTGDDVDAFASNDNVGSALADYDDSAVTIATLDVVADTVSEMKFTYTSANALVTTGNTKFESSSCFPAIFHYNPSSGDPFDPEDILIRGATDVPVEMDFDQTFTMADGTGVDTDITGPVDFDVASSKTANMADLQVGDGTTAGTLILVGPGTVQALDLEVKAGSSIIVLDGVFVTTS